MIPALDARGLLPPGIHDAADWCAFGAAFATNDHRRRLLDNMLCWIERELQHVAAGLELVVGGSFLTSKLAPGDIDCTVIFGVDELSARGAAFGLLVRDGAKGRIWQTYGVEAYPTLRWPGANDFSAYFQYVGDKSAVLHRCAPTDLRGVIRVASWLPG